MLHTDTRNEDNSLYIPTQTDTSFDGFCCFCWMTLYKVFFFPFFFFFLSSRTAGDLVVVVVCSLVWRGLKRGAAHTDDKSRSSLE